VFRVLTGTEKRLLQPQISTFRPRMTSRVGRLFNVSGLSITSTQILPSRLARQRLTKHFVSINCPILRRSKMGHDVSKLERHLETLNRRVTELNSMGFSKEMLLIIHRPGWTTVAEFSLVVNA